MLGYIQLTKIIVYIIKIILIHLYCKEQKEVNRLSDFSATSIDAASAKKVGRADAGKDLFQRQELIPNDIDPSLFGVDKASEFGPRMTQLRTICLRSFQGTYGDNKLHREGTRPPLDYAVTGPTWELKANSGDMMNVNEVVHTDKLHKKEAEELLYCPKDDDLEAMPLDFRLAYLRFQLRMRFINLIK